VHSADLLLTRAIELAGDGPMRAEAERTLLDVLAAKGDAERALSLGERLLAQGDPGVRLVLAQVAASAERWDVAGAYLSAVPADGSGDGGAAAGVLAARLAHARGRPEQALEMARRALAAAREREEWSAACQALEVIGRAERLENADGAREAFEEAERLAVEHDLPLDRVSALHELGTVDLLVDGSTARLERARSLAYDAGVLKLAATLDLQISAGLLHRDVDRALVHAHRCADLARRLRADLLWATAVYFQAVAHAHRREDEEVERCVRQALALAPDDVEINAGIWGAVRAHVALLADDRPQLADCLDRAIDYLRQSPTTTPTPIRGLWALVRTLDGRDGARAREEARPSTVNWENAALLGYAEAVEAGRDGRRRDADRLLAEADRRLADLPWWRHRIRLLVAETALTDGWGDPVGWAREALPVFANRGDSRLATRCRELLRKAGAPVPRPGRGDTPVPAPLRAAGVTSREVDVLRLVAEGMTNTAIARKLVLSPRTVETHVANLVAKTGVPNRAGLAELARHAKSGSAAD
jgi:DNA-binding CsgD family transcriptional regulator/tetratricopeptide (TPR) repeat protein